MNDPKDQPIAIEEQRAWLAEHKQATGLSWKQLAGRIGVNHSTLSLFVGNNYNAPGDKIADAVFRYRQTLASQAALKGDVPEIPTYYETPTSLKLLHLLSWAQRGRIVVGALSPGLGKTIAAKHYTACNANVFMVTITPATSKLNSMMNAVMPALGRPGAVHYYRTHALSRMIVDTVKSLGNPLLIVDEAQHLDERAIEEIRSWHDAVGLGIAFLGNAGLLQTLEGGARQIARAQLFSRISLPFEAIRPQVADVEAMLDAWRIRDPKICDFVHTIAMKPGALRGATFALELAFMIASSLREDLALGHVQDAWAQLSRRPVAA